MVWQRIKYKHDPDDILYDVKINGKRIYHPVSQARRVQMKSEK